jgi:hypothetical protein
MVEKSTTSKEKQQWATIYSPLVLLLARRNLREQDREREEVALRRNLKD